MSDQRPTWNDQHKQISKDWTGKGNICSGSGDGVCAQKKEARKVEFPFLKYRSQGWKGGLQEGWLGVGRKGNCCQAWRHEFNSHVVEEGTHSSLLSFEPPNADSARRPPTHTRKVNKCNNLPTHNLYLIGQGGV